MITHTLGEFTPSIIVIKKLSKTDFPSIKEIFLYFFSYITKEKQKSACTHTNRRSYHIHVLTLTDAAIFPRAFFKPVYKLVRIRDFSFSSRLVSFFRDENETRKGFFSETRTRRERFFFSRRERDAISGRDLVLSRAVL